jgi:hypothetical protein
MSENEVELDLTQETPEESTASLIKYVPATVKKPYDIATEREKARKMIALTLIWTLIGVLLVSFWLLRASSCSVAGTEGMMKLVSHVFTPLVTLVASAVGFYFGTQPSKG